MPNLPLDRAIDELYQQPLEQFVDARSALAKTLRGADAATVRALAKPTLVPWAVNQLYWRERVTWDRLIASGRALRQVHIGVLEGRRAARQDAVETHRQQLRAATRAAGRFIGASAGHGEALHRTLEALSLAEALPEAAGRFTRPLAPQGFEALAGVTPRIAIATGRSHTPPQGAAPPKEASRQVIPAPRAKPDAPTRAAEARAHAERVRQERAERQARAARQKAEARARAAVARATASEARAKDAWDQAHAEADRARAALASLTPEPASRGGPGTRQP